MEPDVLPRSDHCLSRKQIDEGALKVLYRLHRAGFIAYLVGGGVRDLLLGRTPKDFDVSTSAHPGEIKKLFRNCRLIGRRFRLAHVIFGRDSIIETSTFRTKAVESPTGDLLVRNDNTFGTPEEDAQRRDITINGLFYDIGTYSVIDYVGGLEDLDDRIIRTIGDPNIRYREDPIRMLRVIKFAARLEFEIAADDLAALAGHAKDLLRTSPERLRLELGRLLAGGQAEKAFRLLDETGLLAVMVPEVQSWLDARRATDGGETLWKTLAELDRIVEKRRGQPRSRELTQSLLLGALLMPVVLDAETDGGAGAKKAPAGTLVLPKHEGESRRRRPVREPEEGDTRRRQRRPIVAEGDVRGQRLYAWLAPIMERLAFPRRETERMLHSLEIMSHLLSSTPEDASNRHLLRRAFLDEAVDLLEIHVAAAGVDRAGSAAWRKAADSHAPESHHRERPRETTAAPRRRRRRRTSTRSRSERRTES